MGLPTTSRPLLALTSLGIALSTAFSIGSLTLTYFAIPSILLPTNAPLMPPLELVAERRARGFRSEPPPMQPADSGVGDEDETLLDHGATEKAVGNLSRRQASESYVLRQWFHLFARGMHTFPPMAVGGALCYATCAVMVPGPLMWTKNSAILVKRGLYALAAVLSGGVMIFTLTMMKPVNSALHERVKVVLKNEDEGKANGDKQEETEVLIRRWGRMNGIRAILPVTAGTVALIASMI